MPDFDQRRNGLPLSATSGDPGGVHCVPTSCANLLAYMSTHGFPALGPAYADWENEEDYADITNFIFNLGIQMGTTPTGTQGAPAFSTMWNRIVIPSGFRFIVGHEYRTPSNVVTLREMAGGIPRRDPDRLLREVRGAWEFGIDRHHPDRWPLHDFTEPSGLAAIATCGRWIPMTVPPPGTQSTRR